MVTKQSKKEKQETKMAMITRLKNKRSRFRGRRFKAEQIKA